MNSLQQAFGRKFPEIAPNGVFREREFPAQVFCDYLPRPPQDVEDVLFAMTSEHKTTIAWAAGAFHEVARYCMFYRVSDIMPSWQTRNRSSF